MPLTRTLLILVAALTLNASAQSPLGGKWSAVFVGSMNDRPKTFTEAILDLTVSGKSITGTVEMGDWPGLCQISEGTIDGEHFSFVATGELWSSTGYPRIKFDGTMKTGVMKLTMTWGYVGQTTWGRTRDMEAKRIPR